MSSQRVFVYGGGGHGKVVADILLFREDLQFAGFVDDKRELRGQSILGLPVLGDGDWLEQECRREQVGVVLGVADNFIRQKIADKCVRWGAKLVTLVHPGASVSKSARLEVGTVVMTQAAINPCARVGSGAIVNTGAVVEHDVEVGDFAHVAPNAVLSGTSRLGKLSHLGVGAVVIQCVSVGSETIIGAGSVVVRDIQSEVIAYGVPARVIRKVETR
jgi:UDP-N-acetylbacillosamine N-acetyltransferase